MGTEVSGNGSSRYDEELVRRIMAEYREMPELSVTVAQARRLWRLDPETCEAVLQRLLVAGSLRRTKNGQYVSAERGLA